MQPTVEDQVADKLRRERQKAITHLLTLTTEQIIALARDAKRNPSNLEVAMSLRLEDLERKQISSVLAQD